MGQYRAVLGVVHGVVMEAAADLCAAGFLRSCGFVCMCYMSTLHHISVQDLEEVSHCRALTRLWCSGW